MTSITAAMVKELRERTSVGMMECKKALVETNGDMEQAIEVLRKAGQAKTIKKGDRTTAEGLVALSVAKDNKSAAIVEINCETDFVAREAQFHAFAQQVSAYVLQSELRVVDALLLQKLETGKTIEETRIELISKLGENIVIRRIDFIQESIGVLGSYLHGGENLARIASVVCLDVDDFDLAKDLAMHVAAMKPEYIDNSEVPKDRIAKEKEIFMAQVKEENNGKPDNILEKIVTGKVNKFIKESTLLGQAFVKDSNQTVEQLLNSKKAKVVRAVRFEVGEGIEKKAEDFVGEVMSQVK